LQKLGISGIQSSRCLAQDCIVLRSKLRGNVENDRGTNPILLVVRGRTRFSADDHFCETASFAHRQNFSVAGLSRPFGAAMPSEKGLGSEKLD
jgi:hypothetical protein